MSQQTTAKQLLKLHADFVRPSDAVLVVVGDFAPARALDQVARALAGWTGARAAARVPKLPRSSRGRCS